MTRTLIDYDKWLYEANHLQTSIWVVSRIYNDIKQFGFFKYHWANPHLGVDYVVSKIAWDLGLSTPEVALANVTGKDGTSQLGLVSLSVPVPHHTWAVRAPSASVGNYEEPWRMITNIDELIGMFVFDVWVGNTDRHGANVMLHEAEPGPRLQVWAIDHGHVFGNANWLDPECPGESQELPPEQFFRSEQIHKGDLLRRSVRSAVRRFEDLLEWVSRIHQLGDKYNGYIQACEGAGLLTTVQADRMQQILAERSANLSAMLRPWWQCLMAEKGRCA